MTRTADDILREHGLPPAPAGKDRYYTTCLKCSAERTKAHQTSRCLGITINEHGVHFGCSHCGWKGGGYFNGRGNGRARSSPFVAFYDYTDELGDVLFQVCRRADKASFPQRKPDGKGGWDWKTGDVRKVLYRLPELLEAMAAERTVLVVEGEKDVESLRTIGVPATCSPGGAAEPDKKPKWRQAYSELLRGADIVVLNDNDPAGYAHAEATASMSRGIAKRVRRLDLARHWPNMPTKADVSDWLAAGHGREELDALIEQAPDHGEPPAKPLPFINMSKWDTERAPPRQWAVEDRIPLKQPYLFTGHGAAGKSLIELMRACAHVLGKTWLGMPVTQGPVVYMGAEDDEDELHRRLDDILGFYGATYAEAIAGGLHLLSYVGEDCMLGVPDKSGIIRPTPLFGRIEEAAADIKPVAAMIDTVSDVFGGSEIDRGHVTQFIKMLQGMAVRASCSVAILAHPSNAGMASGSGISGSTGWHNKVRARAYMRAIETPKGEEPDPDLREIQFLKNNYGRQGDSIQVRWQRGVYVLEGAPSSLERLAQDQHDDERFVELLKRYEGQGRKVGESKSANNYAPKVFAEEGQDGKRLGAKRFERAMQRLLTARKIHVHSYGRPSNLHKCIALGSKP